MYIVKSQPITSTYPTSQHDKHVHGYEQAEWQTMKVLNEHVAQERIIFTVHVMSNKIPYPLPFEL